MPSRETGLNQVAAGGRFPVDHFSGDEYAGNFSEHERFIQLAPANAPG